MSDIKPRRSVGAPRAAISVALRSCCLVIAATPALSLAAESISTLEEIVVTARKRVESREDKPTAI